MRHLNLIAVDVSESSIKVLKLNPDNSIKAYGSAPLRKGVVENGQVIDVDTFSRTLIEILKTTKPTILFDENTIQRAFLCLPESKLFSHHCVIPDTVKDKDIEAYLYAQAAKIIPFELNNLYGNYHVVVEKGMRNATYIGIEKAVLDNYVKAFVHSNVRPAFVGGELFALGRALLPNPVADEDCIIVDIGARFATIGMFGMDAVPNDSILFPFGGDYLTNFLADRLKVSFEEAEKLKCEFGVDITLKETQVQGILRESLTALTDKINEAKSYFEAKTGSPIRHIIVAGGSALLPGIATFIAQRTTIETTIADPLFKISGRFIMEKEATPNVLFANVVGLALAASNSDFTDINLLTTYDKDEAVVQNDVVSISDIRSSADFLNVLNNFWRKGKARVGLLLNLVKTLMLRVKVKAHILLAGALLVFAVTFLGWVLRTYL